ncbi:MAG TPA: HNH endonuclease signature motif containing protein [Acidimicrobiales bacterium]|jgi:hypothetical protein|nr:HNH endonuclease signature motif containing protein [Acidimicrobiales bacterium]
MADLVVIPARFSTKVVAVPDGCRFWVGAIADDGYGRWTTDDDRTVSAHRWLWEQLHGPVPPGLHLLHSCDETSCVDDAHLRVGTQAENQAQMARRHRGAGPWHVGMADTRGPAGRARAIRAALLAGYDAERLAAALAAGDANRDQLRLDLGESGPATRR